MLVSLLILHNLHALPLFLLLLLTVDEEPPPRQEQPQWAKIKKDAHLLCKATARGAEEHPLAGCSRFEATQVGCLAVFASKSSGKKLMDCYLVVSLAQRLPHTPRSRLPRPLCVQLKRSIFACATRARFQAGATLVLRLQLMKLLQVHLCDPHTPRSQANIFTTFLQKFLLRKMLELIAKYMHKICMHFATIMMVFKTLFPFPLSYLCCPPIKAVDRRTY